jgi:aminobenzoyl-glutamate utilization protein B
VAKITHCTLRQEWVTKTRPGLPNHAIAALTYGNLMLGGAPSWGEAAQRFGQEIQKNLGLKPMAAPIHPAMSELVTPEDDEARMRAILPPWQKNYTSDDYTDYTWHCPTARLYVGRAMLAAAKPGYQYPTWVWNALGGYPATIDPTIFSAARAIAGSLVDLLTDPQGLAAAQSEFRERTGGGIGGSKWVGPLLPKNFPAPIHYRWPEYVTTPRGEEWWLPQGA